MNLAPALAPWLSAHGHEARHWFDIGPPTSDDSAILARARAEGCVLITRDLDFGAILAATAGLSPSVVQLRAGDGSADAVGPRLLATLRATQAELAAGALVTVTEHRHRVRVLPIVPPGVPEC